MCNTEIACVGGLRFSVRVSIATKTLLAFQCNLDSLLRRVQNSTGAVLQNKSAQPPRHLNPGLESSRRLVTGARASDVVLARFFFKSVAYPSADLSCITRSRHSVNIRSAGVQLRVHICNLA